MTAAAIILAAGASTRLGAPKQLVLLEGETLLDRAVRVAGDAGCDPVIVVLGANAAAIQAGCRLRGALVIINPQWREGMASSVRLAVAALSHNAGTILMTCDMPAVTPAHLRALVRPRTLTASRYANHAGVPAFFPASTFPNLLALTGETGARHLLQSASLIDLRGGELDIDTPEDLAAMLRTPLPNARLRAPDQAPSGRSQIETGCG